MSDDFRGAGPMMCVPTIFPGFRFRPGVHKLLGQSTAYYVIICVVFSLNSVRLQIWPSGLKVCAPLLWGL